jgi:nucleoid DNA-binding protein
VNKHDLIATIAQDTGATKSSAAATVEAMLEGHDARAQEGDAVTFVGFGTFKTTQRRARVAKNPRTATPSRFRNAASCALPPASPSKAPCARLAAAEGRAGPFCYNFPF